MIIYSWNMLYRNKELDRAFEFISHADFDFFCLQEVPEDFLKRLATLPYPVASSVDTEKIFPSGAVPMHTVILSRHPIASQGEIPFDDYQALLPLRARLFTRLMRPFHFAPVRNRSGLYIDTTADGVPVRIFSLHLSLTNPSWRLEEFERAMLKRDPSRPSIVCGDFNIVEAPHVALLNWIFGGRVSDALRYQRERTTIEDRFVAHELTNVLRGAVTHPFSRSQLDHLLVSRSFSIRDAAVLPDRMGSDHHPIRAEIE